MRVRLREIEMSELDKAVAVLNHIPEFDSIFYTKILEKRLNGIESIILLAEFAGKPIGCKIAYNRYFDGSIYSWLGGVLLPFRNQGVAFSLLLELEKLAKERLFSSIRFKTRNKLTNMQHFALKNGFYVSGFDPKVPYFESRIEYTKLLI